MTPAEMVKGLAAEGVMVGLTSQGRISVRGDLGAVSRWATLLKARKSDLISYLVTEKSVTDWLERIEEDDIAVIGEVLHQCRNSCEAWSYFLWRAKEGNA